MEHIKKESTTMETSINSIGVAVVVQSIIRWLAIGFIAWLCLSYIDGWVLAALK